MYFILYVTPYIYVYYHRLVKCVDIEIVLIELGLVHLSSSDNINAYLTMVKECQERQRARESAMGKMKI